MYVCLLWFVTYDWICMYVVMFCLHMLERYVFIALAYMYEQVVGIHMIGNVCMSLCLVYIYLCDM